MKLNPDSPARGRAAGEATLPGFSFESIRPVRDFTARKTLEQAHALAAGLIAVARDAEHEDEARRLLVELASVGVTPGDAEELARQAAALIEAMADRDRKADVFHAAVKEAGAAERAMYERLALLARLLRVKLGARSPALSRLGVPPDAPPRLGAPPVNAEIGAPSEPRARTRPPSAMHPPLAKCPP